MALHLVHLQGPGQLHRVGGVQLAVVLVQHGAAAEAMPLVEGDGGRVAGLHMQVGALDGRVLGCQPQRAAQQVAACGNPRDSEWGSKSFFTLYTETMQSLLERLTPATVRQTVQCCTNIAALSQIYDSVQPSLRLQYDEHFGFSRTCSVFVDCCSTC